MAVVYLVYTVLVLAFTAPVFCQPRITKPIRTEVKRFGETGRLDCFLSYWGFQPVFWIHKDSQTVISKDNDVIIPDSSNVMGRGLPKYETTWRTQFPRVFDALIINNLEPRDAGLYTCQIGDGQQQLSVRDGEIVVLYPPTIVRSMTSRVVKVEELGSANLTCDASGFPRPNITWIRVNGDPNPNGALRHLGKTMLVENVKPEHGGIYRCLADNNLYPSSYHDATLVVMHRPTARAMNRTYEQADSPLLQAIMYCRIGGYPEPDLHWYYIHPEGTWVEIVNDDRHSIYTLQDYDVRSPYERIFQLTIRSMSRHVYRDYVCEGRNEYGRRHDIVTLTETPECQGPHCPTIPPV